MNEETINKYANLLQKEDNVNTIKSYLAMFLLECTINSKIKKHDK